MFLITLIPLACLFGISSDIYAPSVPDIAQYMHTSINAVQATMPMLLTGVVLSQMIYGFFMEVYGRKTPIIIGLLIFLIGNFIAISASTILMLNFARFIQGFGVGATTCGWRTLFRDRYTKQEMSKYGGYCSIIMAFMVPAAPLIGGLLHEAYNWQASFYFMSLYSLIVMLMICKNVKEVNSKTTAKTIYSNLGIVFKNKAYILYCFASLLFFGGFFSWFVAGPALIIDAMGYSPSYFGLMTFMFGSLSIAISGYLNGKFVERFGANFMLNLGTGLSVFSGILLIALFYVFKSNIYAIYAPIAFLYFGVGFTMPNLFAISAYELQEMTAIGSALYSSLQMLGGVIFGYIVAHLPDNSPIPFACTIIAAVILGAIAKTLANKSSKA